MQCFIISPSTNFGVIAISLSLFFFLRKVNKLAVSEAERKDQEESKQDQPIVFGKNINLTVIQCCLNIIYYTPRSG